MRHRIWRDLGVALLLWACVFLSGSIARPQAPAAASDQLKELLPPKLYDDYNQRPNYKDRLDIMRRGMEAWFSDLRSHLKKMDTEVVLEDLRKISALSRFAQEEPSRQSASPKDLRSKQVKQAEIKLRQIAATLHDYRLSVPFEYRSQFAAAVTDLEVLRNQLLVQLFGKAAASPRPPG
jgi:hypothetical protein